MTFETFWQEASTRGVCAHVDFKYDTLEPGELAADSYSFGAVGIEEEFSVRRLRVDSVELLARASLTKSPAKFLVLYKMTVELTSENVCQYDVALLVLFETWMAPGESSLADSDPAYLDGNAHANDDTHAHEHPPARWRVEIRVSGYGTEAVCNESEYGDGYGVKKTVPPLVMLPLAKNTTVLGNRASAPDNSTTSLLLPIGTACMHVCV